MSMTVAELRAILSTFPDDALVAVDNHTDPNSVSYVRSSGSCSTMSPDQMVLTRTVVLSTQDSTEIQTKTTKVTLNCQ